MKLLIITQKVDKKDPILGFFHDWILEFAQKIDSVVVICLEKGDYDLPHNVKVLSLGKENGQSRLKYILNFYKYIWQERQNYNTVFVHMNQEYVLLAGLWWRLFGKKILLWRNFPSGNWRTSLAVKFAHVVFCTSPYSYTAKFKKTILMPVGIDTSYFTPSQDISRDKDILFIGRLDKQKQPDLLLQVLGRLKKEGIKFSATFVGKSSKDNNGYRFMLDKLISEFNLEKEVSLPGAVSNSKTRDYYWSHKLFVNLAPSGCLDKTIFEAMACGCDILVTNDFLHKELGDRVWCYNSIEDILEKIKIRLQEKEVSEYYIDNMVKYVKNNHSLKYLVGQIKNYV